MSQAKDVAEGLVFDLLVRGLVEAIVEFVNLVAIRPAEPVPLPDPGPFHFGHQRGLVLPRAEEMHPVVHDGVVVVIVAVRRVHKALLVEIVQELCAERK